MKLRWIPLLYVLMLCAAEGRTRSTTVKIHTDAGYVSALATANRFLSLWQAHDEEGALPLLTDEAKHKTSVERVEALFSGNTLLAYEITHGRKLKNGRYSFPVVIFRGEQNIRPRYSDIVVVESGKNDWAIDKLP